MGSPSNIERLARCWGLVPRYTDALGRRRVAGRASLLPVLRAVGAPVERLSDVDDALRARHEAQRTCLAPPVLVLWEGDRYEIDLQCTPAERRSGVTLRIRLERGEVIQRRSRLPSRGPVALPGSWESGYHTLEIECAKRSRTVYLLAAPRRCHDDGLESWGVFMPLHALHRADSARVASYGDLGRLLDWSSRLGATHLATLPLLPIALDRPVDPSPYRPLSRRLWSELYVDPASLPGWRPPRSVARGATGKSIFLDHAAEWERLEPLLAAAARRFFATPDSARGEFRSFLRRVPQAQAYARFRAAWKVQGRPWMDWPPHMRRAALRDADVDPGTERLFLFAQWAAARQMDALRPAADSASLYLDLPLGTHPHGFDCYQQQQLFAHEISVGAPPDAFMAQGQHWAFPPILPERSRETGHRYFAECLRHAMSAAGMLRIDHVMSLHRLFWIPQGADACDGIYVRYPAEELYAVLCLESRRARCKVAGEDLGTVPRELRPALRRHAVLRTSVLQNAEGRSSAHPLTSLVLPGVASLQTHDMPPFADWWRGSDIDRRLKLGLLSESAARRELRAREQLRAAWLRDLGVADSRRLLPALLSLLCDCEARCVLVDLEDLWGESRPQNIPGTTDAWPNWRRRARLPFETFRKHRGVLSALRRLAARDRRPLR